MSSNDSHQGRVGDSRTVRLRPGFVDRKDSSFGDDSRTARHSLVEMVRQQIKAGTYDSDGKKSRVAFDAMLAQVQHKTDGAEE